MLFNSLGFLLLFLPVVLLGYRMLLRTGHSALVLGWLTLASLCFYGAWSPGFLTLLLCHVALNGTMARWLPNRRVFVLAICLNLAILGLFKYADFALGTVNHLSGTNLPALGWVLPVGISFFTFTQIAFLADLQRGHAADRSPLRYLLFVTWFPHLVAGPIIHHAKVMPQLARAALRTPRPLAVQAGLSLFVLGLAKKLLIADTLATHVQPAYAAAQAAHALDSLSAWLAVFAYALQLYFDFSGYSDMACGLSLMFGVRLPLNFYSPYQAVGVIEFWRRWHITLSNFLRDYLYIPLGGNRRGPWRHRFNLMATMVLGGLWHGASWNFVLWGALHGFMLVVNQAWRKWSPWRLPGPLAVGITFLLVALAWIPFRAPDMETAQRVWWALWSWPAAGLVARLNLIEAGSAVALGLLVVWFLPNTAQIMGPLVDEQPRGKTRWWRWRPDWVWALLLGVILGVCMTQLARHSPFLYFQF